MILNSPKSKLDGYQRPVGMARIKDPIWRDIGLLALILLAVGVSHLVVPGSVPSGADGGNWLAIAQERLGTDVMSSDVTYPIAFPAVVAGLLQWFSPISAIVIAGIFAKLALVAAVYWCVRPIGALWGAIAAVITAFAGAQLEAFAWGGYAQLLGTAAGVLALLCLGRYMTSGQTRPLLSALAWASLVYATHALITGLLVLALPLSAAYMLFMRGFARPLIGRAMVGVAVLAAPGAAVALWSVVGGGGSEIQPVLNPLELDWIAAVQNTVREAPWPWALLTATALVAAFWRGSDDAEVVVNFTGFGWTMAGVGFFVVSGEPRSLLPTQIGIVMLAIVGVRRLLRSLKSRSHGTISSKLLIVVGVSLLSALVMGGVGAYVNATGWYRVVDVAELRGLDTLRARARPGDLVLASMGHHGNPIGWWVEGYAGVHTYSSVDPRFLAFPDERQHAMIAIDFFSGRLTVEESRELVEASGADFLLVDRRGSDAGWLAGESAKGLQRLIDSATIVILEATPRVRNAATGTTADERGD